MKIEMYKPDSDRATRDLLTQTLSVPLDGARKVRVWRNLFFNLGEDSPGSTAQELIRIQVGWTRVEVLAIIHALIGETGSRDEEAELDPDQMKVSRLARRWANLLKS